MDPRQNTDRELWREPDTTGNGDFYSDSIHVTASGGIGINCGGHVVVMPLRKWHALALVSPVPPPSADARAKLEQAVKDWQEKRREVDLSSLGHPLMEVAKLAEWRRRARAALAEAEAALLALPPHEGETPRYATAEEVEASRQRMIEKHRKSLERLGKAEGETPQPAAEPSGWRDIASAPKDVDVQVWAREHGNWGYTEDRWRLFRARLRRFAGERDYKWSPSEATGQYWCGFTPTHWMPLPLPPVVQTRPEEPNGVSAVSKTPVTLCINHDGYSGYTKDCPSCQKRKADSLPSPVQAAETPSRVLPKHCADCGTEGAKNYSKGIGDHPGWFLCWDCVCRRLAPQTPSWQRTVQAARPVPPAEGKAR